MMTPHGDHSGDRHGELKAPWPVAMVIATRSHPCDLHGDVRGGERFPMTGLTAVKTTRLTVSTAVTRRGDIPRRSPRLTGGRVPVGLPKFCYHRGRLWQQESATPILADVGTFRCPLVCASKPFSSLVLPTFVPHL